jgi:hypothetical protein
MNWDAASAKTLIASETEWDSEPALSAEQQQFLLDASRDTGAPTYTIESIGATIYLGLSWKLSKAMEYHDKDGEAQIFDHIERKLKQWAVYANAELSPTANAMSLFELEVGHNFIG